MKHYAVTLFAALVLSSCERNSAPEPAPAEDYIQMGAEVSQTRGTAIETIDALPYFNVLTYYHKVRWNKLSASNPPAIYMYNVSVRNVGNGWVYSPQSSWPKEGFLSFFGYYPAPSSQNGITVTAPLDGTAPRLTYRVPEAVEEQPDILVATNDAYNLDRANSSSRVNFSLHHALTSVSLRATGSGERILGVRVSGVVGTGSLFLGEGSVTWKLDMGDSDRSFAAGVSEVVLGATPRSVLRSDGLLMMLPQVLSEKSRLTITILRSGEIVERVFSLRLPNKDLWLAGASVEYLFAL